MTPRWWKIPTDADVDRELRGYLVALVEEKVRAGIDPATARREALIEIGGMTQVKERVRDDRPAARLELMAQDIRYALRTLRHQPAFTFTVIAVLALGIGANATMFGVIDTLLLQPPAEVAAPERVVSITYDRTSSGEVSSQTYLSYPIYLDAVTATDAFEAVAAYAPTTVSAGLGPDARLLRGMRVTSGYFDLLGVRPVLGRFFSASEDGPSPPNVAVLSEGMWRRDYAARQDVIGTHITLAGSRYTVVGIAPARFTGIAKTTVDLWIPFTAGATAQTVQGWANSRNAFWHLAIARLKEGVTPERAAVLATPKLLAGERRDGRTERYIADEQPRFGATSILPHRALSNDPDARVAILVAVVSLLVFIIACANVAGLQVARALQRQREIALRVALGATTRRLVGQLLTESLLLSLAGGLAALAVTVVGGGFVKTVLFSSYDWSISIVDPRMLTFTFLASILAAFAIGVLPVLQARRVDLNAAIKGSAKDSRNRNGARRPLLVVQTALTVMLLVGTGLFVRSLERVRELPLGIQPANVLMADLRTTGMPLSGEQIGALYERLHRAAVQVPGIEGAAIASSLPFHSTYAMRVRVPGRDSLPRIADGGPYYTAATTDYFKVMGMRILRGRGFEPGDQEGSRVVIVNESMAKLWWPGRDALGQCMTIGADTMPCSRVVGIVENPRRQSVIEDMTLQYFIPLPHGQTNSRVLVLRSQTDPTKAAERIRMALQRADPNLPYVRVRPLEELIAPQTQSWRLGARMFSAFGVLSLILAGIGLYGMLAYDVSQRTRELGIRVALGATGREIAAVVVGQGMKLLLAGLIIGLGLALISGRFIEKLLFQTSPSDPIVLSGVVVVLGLVGLVAMVAPTVRATRADPLRALRAD